MKNLTSNKIMLNHVNMLQSVNDWNWDADNSEAYFKSWYQFKTHQLLRFHLFLWEGGINVSGHDAKIESFGGRLG